MAVREGSCSGAPWLGGGHTPAFQWPAAIRWRGGPGQAATVAPSRGAAALGPRGGGSGGKGGTLTAPLYLSFMGRPLWG